MPAMQIGGLLNTRDADAQFRHLQHQLSLDNHSAYTMNHPPLMHHQHSLSQPNSMGFPPLGSPQQQILQANYLSSHSNIGGHEIDQNISRPKTEPAPKPFACSNCGKRFARRSDLARHERIHTGVRPHACDYPGCGKQFIQRSALTVHARVHTGEKPHMCERCCKPFSDSSSLARHRRIHSGKRPYKCPYATCQKTFTRRTTLTRHQNHHTGTVEQAQAETNAKLSMTQPSSQPQSTHGSFSDGTSPTSTTTPTQGLSASPDQGIHSLQVMPQQNNAYQYMAHHPQALPHQHLRPSYHDMASRVTQSLNNPSISAYGALPHARMAMAHHPGANYNPPRSMEPTTTGMGTSGVSPHMPSMAWGSPNNAGLNPAMATDYSGFQDATPYGAYMYAHPNSNVRRPQSTEPEEYEMRQRNHVAHHLAAGNMASMGDWNSIPMQERGFTVSH